MSDPNFYIFYTGIEGGIALLRREQVLRHKVFRAYLTAWRAHQPFSSGSLLEVEDIRVPIAPIGSQLARSLERILSDLSATGPQISDVLLYLRIDQGQLEG